ncbi:NusG domain II-containing protein [Jeotgalibaca sp. A122]|uniref:NusG domain II-containing protein n=1 Tax=Jeotgalibaca sp. A122 TaxID=3457322 RepID=UPI003FD51647
MMKYIKMIRRGDIIVVLLLMLGSFLPLGVFTYVQATADQTNLQAVVEVDGDVVHVFDLVDDGETETYHYKDEHGHENVLVRTGMSVKMTEATCSDQVCVRMAAIDQVGDTILCLPHKMLVEVRSDSPVENNNEIDVLSLR